MFHLFKGHIKNACKVKLSCPICGNRHHTIMCPRLPNQKIPQENTSVYTTHGFRNVILQTIIVTLNGSKMQRPIRALIDSGSQRSYITKRAVRDFGIKSCGEVSIGHTLFGGLETQQKRHGQYLATVKDETSKFAYELELMDQEKICGQIACVPDGIWITELSNVGIELSDGTQEEKEIHILIGSDITSKIYTGRIYHTQSGPVAFETVFGWTLMGQSNTNDTTKNNCLMVTSLFAKDDMIIGNESPLDEVVHQSN